MARIFFLCFFLLFFDITFEKETKSDQEVWIQISKTLQTKVGKLPEYFREYSPRHYDDTQQLIFPSLKMPEIKPLESIATQNPLQSSSPSNTLTISNSQGGFTLSLYTSI